MALQNGGNSTDKFFTAMSYWQLGNKDEARRWYGKAAEKMGKLATSNEELNRVRAEADELLGVDNKSERAALEAARRLNQRAWALATNAEPVQRDPEQAVALAEKAVAELPKDPDCWNTLGVARYRAGDFEGAVAALQKFRELRTNDQEWGNPFFLAMAHSQLGEKDKAHQWYERGIKWMDAKAATSDSLKRFRAEADELLGVKEKKESKPSSTPTQ
jgi:Flp pilus assembly protein TadD